MECIIHFAASQGLLYRYSCHSLTLSQEERIQARISLLFPHTICKPDSLFSLVPFLVPFMAIYMCSTCVSHVSHIMTYPPTLLHALERYILEDKILHMLARYNCRYPDADISSIHKIFAAKQSKTIQTIESELHSLLDNTTLVLPTGEQIYLDRFRFTVRAKDRSGSIYISPTYALATRKEYAQWGIPLSECSFLGST